MKKYEIEITEVMKSVVVVEATSKDEAFSLALEEIREDFEAPYHTQIDVDDWCVLDETELEG